MPKTLIDTNVFVAYIIKSDKYHQSAIGVLENLIGENAVVAAPVLVEVFALVAARAYHAQAISVDRVIRSTCHIEPLIHADMKRMSELLSKYANLELDYVDAAIIAVAERLNITQIATFDRRDFAVVVPAHGSGFTLLPET